MPPSIVCVLAVVLGVAPCRHVHGRVRAANIAGDFTFGGLFPVHKRGDGSKPCGGIQADRGVQRLEAMLYAVDRINADAALLPGITLGAHLLDTCSRETYALDQSLDFIRPSLSGNLRCANWSHTGGARESNVGNIVGVVGGAYSSVSLQVANLLRLFKMPQISYASTSSALSDKHRFEFFARTVPPDSLQAMALADIVQHFNWTYISTVASVGGYGETGIDSFHEEVLARNICIATSVKIPYSATYADFAKIVAQLRRKTSARAVVLFVRADDARSLLQAADREGANGQFVWIASDGWGAQEMAVKGNERAAEGAITIDLQSVPLPHFDQYFKRLRPATNARNPWFASFWEQANRCTLQDDALDGVASDYPRCTENETLTSVGYRQENKVPFVYEAVYALAHALHNLLHDKCDEHVGTPDDRVSCMKQVHVDGEELFKQYILKVQIPGGDGDYFPFDSKGDAVGRYSIMNYRRQPSGVYEYVTVGSWSSELGLQSFSESVVWPAGSRGLPPSRCSEACRRGEIKHVQEEAACCWVCSPCRPWEFVERETACGDCGEGRWPTEDKTGCVRLEARYLSPAYAALPACLSLVGAFLTLVVVVTFVRHRDTPVVRASGRELCFLLLAGFLVSFCNTLLLLLPPTALTCGVTRAGVGVGFALTYSALLVKTNRIARIFSTARRSARAPAYISPRSQVVFTGALVAVQALCSAAWLVLEAPATRLYHPAGQRHRLVLRCAHTEKAFFVSLGYVVLLIVTCTVYAMKTRKIPANFNESKFIGFAMYTTVIIWLAFVPIYFGTSHSFQIQQTTLCVAIALSVWVALVCLFANKIYIILLHPEKNVCILRDRSTRCAAPQQGENAEEHVNLDDT